MNCEDDESLTSKLDQTLKISPYTPGGDNTTPIFVQANVVGGDVRLEAHGHS